MNNKIVITMYLSIITLNINGLNFPTKDIRELNRLENKAHTYAVHKRPISN